MFWFFLNSFLSLDRKQQLLSLKPILLKNEKKKQKTTKPSIKGENNSGRLLIILAGSVLFLALFLITIHELCTYRCISNPIGVHHVANDVYEDIAAANVQMVVQSL